MDLATKRIELQIWQEEGENGNWRCRVVGPGQLCTVRISDPEALSAYVAGQIALLTERQSCTGELAQV